jgi:hypothetical protein
MARKIQTWSHSRSKVHIRKRQLLSAKSDR